MESDDIFDMIQDEIYDLPKLLEEGNYILLGYAMGGACFRSRFDG